MNWIGIIYWRLSLCCCYFHALNKSIFTLILVQNVLHESRLRPLIDSKSIRYCSCRLTSSRVLQLVGNTDEVTACVQLASLVINHCRSFIHIMGEQITYFLVHRLARRTNGQHHSGSSRCKHQLYCYVI